MSEYNVTSSVSFESRTGRVVVDNVYGNQPTIVPIPINRSITKSTNSNLAETILNTNEIIPTKETATATVRLNGKEIHGIWMNREECLNWRGLIPLEEYKINTEGPTHVILLTFIYDCFFCSKSGFINNRILIYKIKLLFYS